MDKPTRIFTKIFLGLLVLLALGWAWGAFRDWNAISSRPVRLAYIIADFGLVIPLGVAAFVGLHRGRRWAPPLLGVALGALLFDVAHGVFYLIWDNYFGVPLLVAFGLLLLAIALVAAGVVILARAPTGAATQASAASQRAPAGW